MTPLKLWAFLSKDYYIKGLCADTAQPAEKSLTLLKRVFVNLSLSNDRRKRERSRLKILVFNLMPGT